MEKARIISEAISLIAQQASKESISIRSIIKSILSHPIKMLATFILAPWIMFTIIRKTKNTRRKYISIFGLTLGLVIAYLTSAAFGTFTLALIAFTYIGTLSAIGVLIGTTFSIVFSVALTLLVFNTICLAFLKICNSEILNHLDSLIDDEPNPTLENLHLEKNESLRITERNRGAE